MSCYKLRRTIFNPPFWNTMFSTGVRGIPRNVIDERNMDVLKNIGVYSRNRAGIFIRDGKDKQWYNSFSCFDMVEIFFVDEYIKKPFGVIYNKNIVCEEIDELKNLIRNETSR